jgi:serine/threonine protein kinase
VCDGPDLSALIYPKSKTPADKLTPEQMISLALHMTEGLAHLHSHDVKHLDVKPQNVLMVRNGQHSSEEYGVRIADFGMAAEEKQDKVYGTWEYLSPECWKRQFGQPCFASDVFSFGIILWELWAGTRVY